jgi:hypothetical protein
MGEKGQVLTANKTSGTGDSIGDFVDNTGHRVETTGGKG